MAHGSLLPGNRPARARPEPGHEPHARYSCGWAENGQEVLAWAGERVRPDQAYELLVEVNLAGSVRLVRLSGR